jgi:hypothetical protein
MMYYGRNGYVEATKKIVETHHYIEKGQATLDFLLYPSFRFNVILNLGCAKLKASASWDILRHAVLP